MVGLVVEVIPKCNPRDQLVQSETVGLEVPPEEVVSVEVPAVLEVAEVGSLAATGLKSEAVAVDLAAALGTKAAVALGTEGAIPTVLEAKLHPTRQLDQVEDVEEEALAATMTAADVEDSTVDTTIEAVSMTEEVVVGMIVAAAAVVVVVVMNMIGPQETAAMVIETAIVAADHMAVTEMIGMMMAATPESALTTMVDMVVEVTAIGEGTSYTKLEPTQHRLEGKVLMCGLNLTTAFQSMVSTTYLLQHPFMTPRRHILWSILYAWSTHGNKFGMETLCKVWSEVKSCNKNGVGLYFYA